MPQMTPQLEKWILKYLLGRLSQMWQWHVPRKQCKQRAYIGRGPLQQHLWVCASCNQKSDTVQVDHIVAKGAAPVKLSELESYIDKYFCPVDNLQCLCIECHRVKTKKDVKHIRQMKRVQ